MRSMLRLIIFIFFTGLICQACSNKSSNTENKDGYISVEGSEIEEGVLKGWKCHEVESDLVCTPESWREVKTGQAFFSSDLGETTLNTYFVINIYNATSSGINLKKHLIDIYDVLKKDTLEVTTEYQLTELVFKDRVAYYGEFLSQRSNEKYYYFTMIWEKDGKLYDVGLKSKSVEKDDRYKIFQAILYNYKHAGELTFSKKDELIKIKHLKFEDLL